MSRIARSLAVLAAVVSLAPPSLAQEPPVASQERPGRAQPAEPKPYEQVITKDAKSDTGVFTVHRIKDKAYYEIPKSEIDREFLWVTQIAKTTIGVGYGGQALGNRVVRWERRNNRILLRSVSYEVVADKSQPISMAVEAATHQPIIMAFDIEAFGKDDAAVIDVSRLFTTDVPEFSARARLRARGMDTQRSFIDRVVSFPENIEVEATHTYTTPVDPPAAQAQPQPAPSPFGGQGMRPGSASVVMHFSMVKLPERPMTPRLFDERVGYFSVRQMDYGQDEQRAPERRYITRYRLEKKDPAAAVSEPLKPIVYWIDPATPPKWRPYLKAGVEWWQPAFEEAGFRNAIVARQGPTPQEDPEWSPEDARYSVIRWLPSTIENASGPHVHDPRTGEILEADVQFYHNVMNLARDWYFVQVGPLDPRARTLPLPDELMGELLAYITAHEVGHTLGFQHNMKASSLYPAEKVRDREWVRKMGHTPTLMDYSRFNYVAQPEDNLDVADLIPRIGPYDKWATVWGYKPIPGAATPAAEKRTLDEWARQQDQTPWLRFSTEGAAGSDPGELTEAVGDANAVWASGLGMKNLTRVGEMLLGATTRPGEPANDLEEIYGRLLGQWVLEMNHVAAIVGGFDSQQRHWGQPGVRFTLVARDRQQAAVRFLNEQAFKTPAFAVNPEILRRIEPTGVLARVRTSQQRVLTSLLNPARLQRMIEQEAIDGAAAYRPTDFLADVRKGIWSELDAARVVVDPYRRNLQRAYLDLVADRLNGRQAVTDDQRAFYRGELRALTRGVAAALARTTDRPTRLHLEDTRDQIVKALDPKFAPPAPPAPAAPGGGPAADEAAGCWPDYAIRKER